MSEGHEIVVCMGSSCFARGNRENLGIIERFLADKDLAPRTSLCGSRCEDCCAEGPNIRIDGVLYHQVDRGTLVDLLQEHFSAGKEG